MTRKTGFKVNITEIDVDTDPTLTGHPCSDKGAIKTGPGQIDFPPGEGKYSNNMDCAWKIIFGDNMRVRVKFSYLDFETFCVDHVEVFDIIQSGSEVSLPPGYFCHGSPEFTSTSNKLLIKFHSNRVDTHKGFMADITEIQGADSGSENPAVNVEPSGLCGVPDVVPRADRIVGGFEVEKHSFPWQVQLRLRWNEHFLCGGSVLSENWVITAAHCLSYSPSDYTVVAGAHDLNGNEADRQIRSVLEIIIHEEYKETFPWPNDIALLRLSHNLMFNTAVKPVCLPRSDEEVPDDKLCITTGWGVTNDFGITADKLMQVYIPIVSHARCSGYRDYTRVTENMICAGYGQGGKASCQGDSGGPLVCSQSGAYVMQGITSWGVGCGARNKPGVKTRTSKYITWIQERTDGAFHFIN